MKKKIFSHFIFFILTLFLLSSPSRAAEKNYTFCYDTYPPYTIGTEGLSTVKGIKSEIVMAIAHAKGFKANVLLMPWARCQEEVKKGRIDSVLPLFKTSEREAFFQFSKKVMLQDSTFFYKKTRFQHGLKWNRFEDLKMYNLGMVRGSNIAKAMEEVFESDNNQILRIRDAESLNRLLLAGRVELIAMDRLVGNFLLEENNLENQIGSAPQSIRSEYVYFATTKNARGSELLELINSFLNRSAGKKEINKIIKSYNPK
jgi:polar amino acid transport system substrate-binding protein